MTIGVVEKSYTTGEYMAKTVPKSIPNITTDTTVMRAALFFISGNQIIKNATARYKSAKGRSFATEVKIAGRVSMLAKLICTISNMSAAIVST